jgi:hypothetical protein
MNRSQMIWVVLLLLGGLWLAWRATSMGAGRVFVVEELGTERLADGWEAAVGRARLSVSRTVGVWVAAFFTLATLSFLYRDNPLYKLAESVVVGVSAAYWMVVSFWTTLIPNLFGKLVPDWVNDWAMPDLSPVRDDEWLGYLVPLVLGGMLLWRLAPRGNWIARWPLAFIVGTTAGIRLVGFIQADFVNQVSATIRPLVVAQEEARAQGVFQLDVGDTISNIMLVIGVFACLVYFFFSVEHKGAVGKVAKLGTWYLMITFGAAFGYTVMGRIALLALRLEFLFDDWLWLIDTRGARPPDWTGWW